MKTNPQAVGAAKVPQRATAAGSLPDSRSSTPCGEPGARTFFLKRPRPPRAERSFGGLPAGHAGTDDALAAARAGNVARADELELAWLNAYGPRPSVEQLAGEPDDKLDVLASAIVRNCGPRGETWIRWSLVEPCPRCWRRLSIRKGCAKCAGWGYMSEHDAVICYTDAELNVVEG